MLDPDSSNIHHTDAHDPSATAPNSGDHKADPIDTQELKMGDTSQLSNNNEVKERINEAQLILALDYGIKKMGMALGNTLTRNARAFDIMAMNNGQPDWDNLLGIIDKWQIQHVIVGLPINIDGSDSMLSKRAQKFARRLAHRLGEQHAKTTVGMFDERLTSREARQLAWDQGWIKHERDLIDDIAACILLDSYFSSL